MFERLDVNDGQLCHEQYRPPFDNIFSVSRFEYRTRVEMVPPDTNRGPSFAGRWVRLGGRKPALPACRDEVLAALEALSAQSARQVFTVREVFVEMAECGMRYAESTVLETMQRMKEPPTWPP
ncbi:MAG: hypothetical protein M0Z91_00965 [Actinomycetota bacterium]|nr:hypothetical protein [Actinomycetota bacterium]